MIQQATYSTGTFSTFYQPDDANVTRQNSIISNHFEDTKLGFDAKTVQLRGNQREICETYLFYAESNNKE